MYECTTVRRMYSFFVLQTWLWRFFAIQHYIVSTHLLSFFNCLQHYFLLLYITRNPCLLVNKPVSWQRNVFRFLYQMFDASHVFLAVFAVPTHPVLLLVIFWLDLFSAREQRKFTYLIAVWTQDYTSWRSGNVLKLKSTIDSYWKTWIAVHETWWRTDINMPWFCQRSTFFSSFSLSDKSLEPMFERC